MFFTVPFLNKGPAEQSKSCIFYYLFMQLFTPGASLKYVTSVTRRNGIFLVNTNSDRY